MTQSRSLRPYRYRLHSLAKAWTACGKPIKPMCCNNQRAALQGWGARLEEQLRKLQRAGHRCCRRGRR